MRQIESFYLKADAVESISSFYVSCAQVEIDDYHDYEKAIAAYNEAIRCLSKSTEKGGGDAKTARRVAEMQDRLRGEVDKIKKFIEARRYILLTSDGEYLLIFRLYENDPGEAMRLLEEMAREKGIDEVVRVGDILSVAILHNVKRRNFKKVKTGGAFKILILTL